MYHILSDSKIIGGAPQILADGSWNKPSIVVSGPYRLNDAPISGPHLAKVLNLKHIADTIGLYFSSSLYLCSRQSGAPKHCLGTPVLPLKALILTQRNTTGPASGLKMCFASMTKGLTAIAIQSFTTAHTLGVLDDLQAHLKDHSPKTGELAAKGLVGMPPKAYRWVDEMKEIAETFHSEGGFEVGSSLSIYSWHTTSWLIC